MPVLHNLLDSDRVNGAHAMDKWLHDKEFHNLHEVALDCRVLCNLNTNHDRGVVNGCTGVVVGICFTDGTEISLDNRVIPPTCTRSVKKILVLLDHTHEVYPFSRTDMESKYHDGKQYVKRTFPLMPAYAVTGRRVQGATLSGPVTVYVTELFTPGLLYVILSRVTDRKFLRIVGRLFADMFVPVPLHI